MVRMYGTRVWYARTVGTYGMHIRGSSMVHTCGARAWYKCMVHIMVHTKLSLKESASFLC